MYINLVNIYSESFSSGCQMKQMIEKINCVRETEDAVIKVPDLMLLNKGTDRKLELRGGFNTDPKYYLLWFFLRPQNNQMVLIIILSRWLTESWPLGGEVATKGREGAGVQEEHHHNVKSSYWS